MSRVAHISAAIKNGKSYAERIADLREAASLPKNGGAKRRRQERRAVDERDGVVRVTVGGLTVQLSSEDRAIAEMALSACSRGRITVMIGGSRTPIARLIMKPPKGMVVDHINGDPADNRRSNLRVCTSSQNAWNMRLQARQGTSRYKGVNKSLGRWRAYIIIEKRQKHLGYFRTQEEAAHAYDNAARANFGEFACLNFPVEGEQSAHRGESK